MRVRDTSAIQVNVDEMLSHMANHVAVLERDNALLRAQLSAVIGLLTDVQWAQATGMPMPENNDNEPHVKGSEL